MDSIGILRIGGGSDRWNVCMRLSRVIDVEAGRRPSIRTGS
jgi:hypothetical protein